VFKVDPKGTLTHIAGTSRPGFSGDGGPATVAQFNDPTGLAFDKVGNLYVADTGNNRVRRISTDGLVRTVAGLGTYKSDRGDGGSAIQAPLYSPSGVALDSAGNLYIGNDQSIRKVSPDGIITTLAGCPVCGVVAGAVLAVSSTGDLYVASSASVWKISRAGTISDIAGKRCCSGGYSGEGGPATDAVLGRIGGIAVSPNGELYMTDMVNSRIFQIAADGTIHTATSGLVGPDGLALDADGNLYVAELGNWINSVAMVGTPAAGTAPPHVWPAMGGAFAK
jgi:sugar lactone lactonase YvrE